MKMSQEDISPSHEGWRNFSHIMCAPFLVPVPIWVRREESLAPRAFWVNGNSGRQ